MRSPSGSELFDADQRRRLQHRTQLGDTLQRTRHIGLARLVTDQDHRDGLLVALGTAFASTTERGDDMMMAMLSRGCRAIRELETLELIRSYHAN